MSLSSSSMSQVPDIKFMTGVEASPQSSLFYIINEARRVAAMSEQEREQERVEKMYELCEDLPWKCNERTMDMEKEKKAMELADEKMAWKLQREEGFEGVVYDPPKLTKKDNGKINAAIKKAKKTGLIDLSAL